MMSFTVLPQNPHKALEALAIYRYLTVKQIVRLGIAASDTVARDHVLKKLKAGRYPLIGTKDFGRWPGYGRLPHIHYLTARGVKYLAQVDGVCESTILYPKGGVQFTRDLFHRIGTIDIHIGLRLWAAQNGYDIIEADLYFDKKAPSRGQAQICASRLELGVKGMIEPDGIFILKRGETIVPIIAEMHHSGNTGRIAEQLNKHAYVIYTGAIRQKYGINVNPIVLSVHEKKHIMLSVQKRLKGAEGFDAFMKGFVFNTVEQIRDKFSKGWSYADQTQAMTFSGK